MGCNEGRRAGRAGPRERSLDAEAVDVIWYNQLIVQVTGDYGAEKAANSHTRIQHSVQRFTVIGS